MECDSIGSRMYQFYFLRSLFEQGPEYPNLRQRYASTRWIAYIPLTKEGEDVLSLLKTTWDCRLGSMWVPQSP